MTDKTHTVDLTGDPHGEVPDRPAAAVPADTLLTEHATGTETSSIVERPTRDRRGSAMLHTLRISLATLLAAAIVVFAVVNTTDIEVDFLTDTEAVPLWTVIAGSAVAGFLLGRILPRLGRR